MLSGDVAHQLPGKPKQRGEPSRKPQQAGAKKSAPRRAVVTPMLNQVRRIPAPPQPGTPPHAVPGSPDTLPRATRLRRGALSDSAKVGEIRRRLLTAWRCCLLRAPPEAATPPAQPSQNVAAGAPPLPPPGTPHTSPTC